MLCRRSASLIISTRRSRAMATSILRKFSAWRSSREENASLPIFVTPSTSSAISAPNSRLDGPGPVHDDRRGHVRGRVGPGDDPHEEDEREVLERLAPEEEQDRRREERGQRGQDGPRERLVDRVVHLLGEGTALRDHFPAVLAQPVVRDDRVVDGVADDGQERRQHRERELAVREREGAQADDHVVDDGDDRRDAALEVEAEGDVDRDPHEADEHEVGRLQLQVTADLRPDKFDATDLEPSEPAGRQRRPDALLDLLGAHGRERQADDKLAFVPNLWMMDSPRWIVARLERICATDGACSKRTWVSVPPVKSMSYRRPPLAIREVRLIRVKAIEA